MTTNKATVKDDRGSSKPIVFDLHPPAWRPRLHPGSRVLGAPDIYLRRPDQLPPPEDDLSESNVKNGLNARPAVGNETFSAHDMIYDRLKGKSIVHQLGSLFDEVAQRREQLAGLRCGPAPSQYRQPQRVTLNEVKLAAYVKELADSSVPLRKLARSVPHGYRGERMLDMLWNGGSLASAMAAVKSQPSAGANGLPTSVAIDRAVWFVRVVGASEFSSSRLRQGNSTAYTAEWTGVLMGWLRRQIVELNIVHHHHHHHHNNAANSPAPSSPLTSRSKQQPATPQKANEEPYALFLEDGFRDRWMAKWSYSLALLRALRYESLVDAQVAARVVLDMLRTANAVQIFVVLALVEEFLEVIVDSVTLLHFALDVLSSKLEDPNMSPRSSGSSVSVVGTEIKAILLYLFDTSADTFVCPSCWKKVWPIIFSARQGSATQGRLAQTKTRNEKLLSGFIDQVQGSTPSSVESTRLTDVQLLDGLITQDDIETVFSALFSQPGSASERVRTILTWSTTEWRTGSFRPFAGATLLQMYVKNQPSRARRRMTQQLNDTANMLERIDMDALLMAWISEADHALQSAPSSGETTATSIRHLKVMETISVNAVVVLLGEMCRRECFSFHKYLQRLTARGLTATGGRERRSHLSRSEVDKVSSSADMTLSDSLHMKLLRSIPLISCSAPLAHQRRIAIYGNRSKESWEEAMERRAVREIISTFPFLTDISSDRSLDENANDRGTSSLTRFWSSSRYVRSRIIQQHILPVIRQQDWLAKVPDKHLIRLLALLSRAEEYAPLWEILESIGEDAQPSMQRIAQCVIDENRTIWLAMGISVSRQRDYRVVATLHSSSRSPADGRPTAKAAETTSRSIKEFCEGREGEGLALIRDINLSTELAMKSVMDAVVTDDAYPSERLAAWLERASLDDQDGSAKTSILVSSLAQVQTSGKSESLKSLTIRLICRRLISTSLLMNSFLKLLQELSLQSLQDTQLPGLLLLTSIVTALFDAEADWDKETLALRSGRSLFVNDGSLFTLISIVSLLGNAEQALLSPHPNIASALSRLRRSVCKNTLVQSYVQNRLVDSVAAIRKLASGAIVHGILADLLPLRWPWKSDQELADQFEILVRGLDVWRYHQTLTEVLMVIDAFQKPGASEDSDARMQDVARLICARMLPEDDSALTSSTLAVLASSSGSNLAACLLDERIKTLNLQLEATFVDEDRVKSCLRSLLQLQRILHKPSPSVPSAAAYALRLVTEWFESSIPTTPSAEAQTAIVAFHSSNWQQQEAESLVVRMGVVCMLLQIGGLLGSPSARTLAVRLFCAILRITVAFSRRADASSSRLHSILDVATYLLQQAPADVQHAMQARALEQVGVSLQLRPSPMDNVAARISALINYEYDPYRLSSTSKAPQFIEAQSCTSAFVGGQFVPVSIKPWDLHPHVDAPGAVDGTGNQSGQQSMTRAAVTEMANLTNTGPISLQHFGAYRTLDRLPSRVSNGGRQAEAFGEQDSSPPSTLHCEGSYGLHLAGEPVYARDARRGLLAMHPIRKTDSSSQRMVDVRHLTPALWPVKVPVRPTMQTDRSGDGGKEGETQGKDTNKVDSKTNTSKANPAHSSKDHADSKPNETSQTRKRKTTAAAAGASNDRKAPTSNARKRTKKD